jgi:malate synthase
VRRRARLAEGVAVTPDLVRGIEREELDKIRAAIGEEAYAQSRFADAADLFEHVALGEAFVEFLTLPAYARID